jgi:cold shock CspA family protein
MSSNVSNSTDVIVEEELSIIVVGKYVGQCKWFNDMLGYGFVTICEGNDKGKDIFVHHSGIQPLNSNYKTLRKGEYLNFNIIKGMNGLQAVDVTGINGGPLMCDFVSVTRGKPTSVGPTPTPNTSHYHSLPQVGSASGNANASTSTSSTSGNASTGGNASTSSTSGTGGKFSPANMTQWYVVTKTGRKKNLAKYSKEGRQAMKQAKTL